MTYRITDHQIIPNLTIVNFGFICPVNYEMGFTRSVSFCYEPRVEIFDVSKKDMGNGPILAQPCIHPFHISSPDPKVHLYVLYYPLACSIHRPHDPGLTWTLLWPLCSMTITWSTFYCILEAIYIQIFPFFRKELSIPRVQKLRPVSNERYVNFIFPDVNSWYLLLFFQKMKMLVYKLRPLYNMQVHFLWICCVEVTPLNK